MGEATCPVEAAGVDGCIVADRGGCAALGVVGCEQCPVEAEGAHRAAVEAGLIGDLVGELRPRERQRSVEQLRVAIVRGCAWHLPSHSDHTAQTGQPITGLAHQPPRHRPLAKASQGRPKEWP
jgi:hypothetical protein